MADDRPPGEPVLEIEDLDVRFATRRGEVRAVNGVNLRVGAGEILGLVGESGCGKSTVLFSILRLIASPGRITGGALRYQGRDLLALSKRDMQKMRGSEIAMIFQDPMATLNPVFPVGEQIRESLRIHRRWGGGSDRLGGRLGQASAVEERARVLEVMREVGIPAPEARYQSYPHQFSGGMQQRALIAIALACRPRLLLADEPTTALDVTTQAQIVELMRQINREHGTAIILVTHNLALAAEFCDRIAVMYAGRIVEAGTTEEVLFDPQHPYTQGLLRSIPRMGARGEALEPIPGEVPDLAHLPAGLCPFLPRCDQALSICSEQDPPWTDIAPGRHARCWLPVRRWERA